jgi:hypothetical protein
MLISIGTTVSQNVIQFSGCQVVIDLTRNDPIIKALFWPNFRVNTTSNINLNYKDVQIKNTCNTKFLGLIIDNTLSWKGQINQLVTKLNAASYSVKTLSAVMTQESLRMIYFAYVHSIMSYGIIL